MRTSHSNQWSIGRMVASAALAMALAGGAGAAELYVDDDAPPGGDGTSWTTAHRFLRDALTAAALSGGAITEVRVAQGTYYPDETTASPNGNGLRGSTFSLVAGVAIVGGYAGVTEADPFERDPQAYVTVLSGDLLGDDLPGGVNRTDNAFHVLNAFNLASEAIVDGVVVTAGNSNAFGANFNGGGITAFQSAVTIINTIFDDNTAFDGAGAFVGDGPITFDGCTFTNNVAIFDGGAILRGGSSGQLTIKRCTFESNSAGVGGAIELNNEDPAVSIDASIFRDNSATFGGAISSLSNGMMVMNSLFVGNAASNTGGAISVVRDFSNPDPGPEIINCTVTGNSANTGGGIGTTSSNAEPVITNCIVWGNTDSGGSDESAQIDFSSADPGLIPLVTFTDIEGLAAGGVFDSGSNVGNIGDDPLFVDPLADDYHLTAGSPCIDAGDTAALPEGMSTDLDGNDRVVDGTGSGVDVVDMGAYEFSSVDSDGDGLLDDIEIIIGTDPFNPDTDGDGMLDGAEVAAANGTGCPDPLNPDSDADALLDGAELTFGTDPCNPDTDADGLLDGTEVDTANGTGCPDPLNPDSDADTLSDGDEVALGTNPCDPDTDGDGVDDATDPTPTEPGVPGSFLEQMILDAADFVDSLPLELFEGKNDNVREGRRNKLASNLRKAAKEVGDEDYLKAIDKLEKNMDRIDADPNPKDWMVPSAEQQQLYADHQLFRSLALILS